MSWVVYCIQFDKGQKTYVGATVDFSRRIRQHNTELVGGAIYTTTAVKASKTGSWKPIFIVRGFPHQQSALQFEWALKHETMAHRTEKNLVKRRKDALQALLKKERVTSHAEPLHTWDLKIQYF
jgi:structure-specific endonuclease subunit SLX1